MEAKMRPPSDPTVRHPEDDVIARGAASPVTAEAGLNRYLEEIRRFPMLAACRTGVDFYVSAIVLQIERLSLLKIIAAIADDRWRKVSGYQAAIQASIESAQPRLSACIRLMFQAMVTRLHSPRTQSSPRSRNWRNPITDLMMPNTGSGVCLRRP
jgi:hypothetical protein